jgi:hypothetical protein
VHQIVSDEDIAVVLFPTGGGHLHSVAWRVEVGEDKTPTACLPRQPSRPVRTASAGARGVSVKADLIREDGRR